MRLLGLLASVLLLMPGCAGYRLGPVKPSAMGHVHKLAVPAFRNKTLEPRLEVLVANALIKQLHLDGTYQITSEEDADAIVEGTVDSINRSPLRGSHSNDNPTVYTDFYQTTEFNLTLATSIKVMDKKTGAELMSRSASGSTSFFISGANPRTANVNSDEHRAIPLAADDAASHLTSYLSEGW